MPLLRDNAVFLSFSSCNYYIVNIMKRLAKGDLKYVERGDSLVFDSRGMDHYFDRLANIFIKSRHLENGHSYTVRGIEPAYKYGEGTLIGYYIKLDEVLKVPYEFFFIDEKLEKNIAFRKK